MRLRRNAYRQDATLIKPSLNFIIIIGKCKIAEIKNALVCKEMNFFLSKKNHF